MITKTVVLLLAMSAAACPAQQAQSQPRRIPVSFTVESEGPQGLWMQSSKDLDKVQIELLMKLVKDAIVKQKDVTLVDVESPKDHMHLAVVAAQVGEANWVIVSSVITMADSKGNDLLVTHDVIAGPNVREVANAIGFQFAAAKLRLITGMMK